MIMRLGMGTLILMLACTALAQDYEGSGRAFIEDLFARRFDKAAARFDATMTQALPADKIPALLDQILSATGAFQAITGTRVEEQGGYHIVVVTCRFEKITQGFAIPFDSSGHVAGLHPGSDDAVA